MICWGQDAPDRLMLDEMRLANEQLQREIDVLKQEIDRKDAEILKLRSMYADAILKMNTTAKTLTALEIQASNLVAERNAGQDSRLTDAMAVIAALRNLALESDDALDELKRRMKTSLDVLKPSDALRTQLEDGLEQVRKPVENSLNLLSFGTGLSEADGQDAGAEVTGLDPEQQVVYLNRGFQQNLRNGQVLCLKRDGISQARVKLVECRPNASAGILIEGNWNALYAGCRLKVEQVAR